jgi:hypothetical protein
VVSGRRVASLLLLLVAAAFAWFVWPTPYKPHQNWQVNRITGTQCGVGESCWRRAVTPPFDASKCVRYVRDDWDAATRAYMDGYENAANAAGFCGFDLRERVHAGKPK